MHGIQCNKTSSLPHSLYPSNDGNVKQCVEPAVEAVQPGPERERAGLRAHGIKRGTRREWDTATGASVNRE